LKISSPKFAYALLANLALFGCHGQSAVAETSAPIDPPVAPGIVKSGMVAPAVSSALFTMLDRTNHAGWDLAELKAYRIADGRLVPQDIPSAISGIKGLAVATPAVTEQPPVDSTFSLPISSGDVYPLAEFRCKVIVQKRFKRGNRYITIRAFEFDNSMGAHAAYDMLRKGSTTVIKRGDGSSDDGDSVSFWQDNFLFIIAGTSLDDDESKDVIGVFATNLSKGVITHAQPPVILSKLPVIDRVRGSERVVMGPASAARAMQAPELETLFSQAVRSAAVADYQVFIPVRERMRLLYIDYADPKMAETAFESFTTRLEELHDPEKGWPSDGRTLFRVGRTFLYCQVKPSGRLLLITGAKKARSPILLAGQVLER